MPMTSNTEADLWYSLRFCLFTGCWEFIGSFDQDGYGRFFWKGSSVRAHRAAWEFTFGTIPYGTEVCHSCDNPKCCNPNHLWLGTNVDNQTDKVNKDRQAKGSKHGRAILTETEVEEIRELVADGRYGILSQTARRYGVSATTICRIRSGRSWNHMSEHIT